MKWIGVIGAIFVGGAVFQSSAQAPPPRCAICGHALGARYWTYAEDDSAYCDSCVNSKPKCDGCGKPMGEGRIEVRGQSLCRECAASRPSCADCRLPILKKYYQVTGIPEVYCDHCYLYHPHCRFCGRPYQDEGEPPAASGPVCRVCNAEAVTDPAKVDKWIRDIRSWMDSDLGLKVELPLRFRVEDALDRELEKPRIDAFQELGAFIVEGDRRSVVLARGLPKARLIETVAHELAHAWQWEVGAREQLLEHKEGFAQWVAGKALQEFGHGAAMVILRERPDLYGRGFRLFEEIERDKGLRAVLSYAKSAE